MKANIVLCATLKLDVDNIAAAVSYSNIWLVFAIEWLLCIVTNESCIIVLIWIVTTQ